MNRANPVPREPDGHTEHRRELVNGGNERRPAMSFSFTGYEGFNDALWCLPGRSKKPW